jgi:putative MFS transporter
MSFFWSGSVVASNPILPVTLLIIGSAGVISILLPYTAENYLLRIRGRASGWTAPAAKPAALSVRG